MSGQRGQLSKLVGRALVGLATTVVAAVLLAPLAVASPIGDAEEAMMSTWEKAGGDTSPLGARKGDVYPIADGFALDFAGGKMFFTTDTGAKFVYGPILDKYEALGGPATSDLGFPTINEVPGLAGPDSRVATFSASDKPVIYWTPDHGAFVVRGALNAAWDKLGSSGGVLGVPVGDETYNGDVASQKFSGGTISWNRKTKQFTTEPAALGDQLKDLQIATDPAAAINMAWRAAGGASGPLGAKKGGQYPIGGDGMVQDFVGGKVFFSQATGANAVESEILAKYEQLGGPVNSDLGFPIANESDGGVAPSSKIVMFSAADKPVIFWTPDHGAFVVRGAMKVAWDKLKGPTGKLGTPVSDQATEGDNVSQKFTGGKISWNRATNTFTTDPANLAPLLSGLQVSGQNQPSGSAMPAHANKFNWHWWYLLGVIPVVILLVLLLLVLFGRRRRRAGQDFDAYGYETAGFEHGHDVDSGYDAAAAEQWAREDAEFASLHGSSDDMPPSEHLSEDEPPARISWPRGSEAAAAVADDAASAEAYDHDSLSGHDDDFGFEDEEEENPDDVDTASIPVPSHDDFAGAGSSAADFADEGFPNHVGFPNDVAAEADYHDDGFTKDGETEFPGAVLGSGVQPKFGRHAAQDSATTGPIDVEEVAEAREVPPPAAPAVLTEPAVAPGPSQPGRPTIHLPLEDPFQAPDGYPIKASARFGLYYTPSSALYDDTIAEIWLASEQIAEANGFIKAD